MSTRFIDIQHDYATKYDLTDNMLEAPQPPFKGDIQMTPYQLVSLQTLLDLESVQCIKIAPESYQGGQYLNDAKLRSSHVVLSEPLGSGKTIIILGLLASRPSPPGIPRIIGGELVKYKKWLRPAIIKVPKAVFITWRETIAKFTYLKCFAFESAKHIIKFEEAMTSGAINSYDIVLVKDGPMDASSSVLAPRESIEIFEYILNIADDACWSRAIYDDYDTIRMTKLAPALFTIFVSATTSISQKSSKGKTNICFDIQNSLINTNFNISNTKAIVEKYLDLPRVRSYLHIFKHPEEATLSALKSFENISEMISDGAVKEISEYFGESITSVADVIYALFRNQVQGIKRNTRVIERALQYIDEIAAGMAANKWAELCEDLRADKPWNPVPPTISDPQRNNLEDIVSGSKGAITRYTNDIESLAHDLKDNECKVCMSTFDDVPMAIMPCCGITLCNECAIKSNHMHTHNKEVVGKCSACSHDVRLANIIFIKNNITADDILNLDVAKLEVDSSKKNTINVNEKLEKLVQLCKPGAVTDGQEIPNALTIMQGSRDAPIPDDEPPRVIIFANHDSTIKSVYETLEAAGIRTFTLEGTTSNIHNTVEEFRVKGDALVINAARYCAGLNLQFATRVVFLLDIKDEKVKAQITSRAMRFARKYNLDIHYLLYKHELNN